MGLADQLQNMSPREQRLLSALGLVFAAMFVLGIPAYIYSDLADSRARNDEIHEVLQEMRDKADDLAARKQERQALDRRFSKPAPALATFVEAAASANGLEVPDTTDRPPIKGAEFTERTTEVKMRKVNLKPLIQMLEKLERSGHPISISRLHISPRSQDVYDVTIGVSAFDRNVDENKKKDGKSKGSTGKKGGKSSSKGQKL